MAKRARAGSRPAASDYILCGVLMCGRCGSSMYTRRYASGRHYLCAAVREARGTCDLPAIAADLVERPTLAHLTDGFGVHLEEWIAARVAEQEQAATGIEARLARERRELGNREHALERARDNAASLLAERPEHTDCTLELLGRLEGKVAQQAERVQHVTGELAQRQPPPTREQLMLAPDRSSPVPPLSATVALSLPWWLLHKGGRRPGWSRPFRDGAELSRV